MATHFAWDSEWGYHLFLLCSMEATVTQFDYNCNGDFLAFPFWRSWGYSGRHCCENQKYDCSAERKQRKSSSNVCWRFWFYREHAQRFVSDWMLAHEKPWKTVVLSRPPFQPLMMVPTLPIGYWPQSGTMLSTEKYLYIVHKMIGMEETDSQPETCELMK